jgi:hypothetical protein
MFRHRRHRVFWLVCPSLLIHEHGRARIIASISTSPNVAPGAVGHSTSSTPPKRLRRFFLFLRSRTPIGSRVSHQHHSAAYGYNSIDQRGLLACKLKRMRLIQSNSQPKSHRRPPATPNSLKSLATPPGFEPGTFSLEGAWSRNDFNARSDIFTVRAPFEAIAEFRFVGMPAARWSASRLRCRSNLHRFEPHLIHRRRLSGRYGISVCGALDLFPGTSAVAELWKIARTRSAWARCDSV